MKSKHCFLITSRHRKSEEGFAWGILDCKCNDIQIEGVANTRIYMLARLCFD